MNTVNLLEFATQGCEGNGKVQVPEDGEWLCDEEGDEEEKRGQGEDVGRPDPVSEADDEVTDDVEVEEDRDQFPKHRPGLGQAPGHREAHHPRQEVKHLGAEAQAVHPPLPQHPEDLGDDDKEGGEHHDVAQDSGDQGYGHDHGGVFCQCPSQSKL